MVHEPDAVRARYERRQRVVPPDLYSPLRPEVWQGAQERQRSILRLFAKLGWRDLSDRSLVEVGCGTGGNLIELLALGFRPGNLIGIELLEDRAAEAERRLPSGIVRLGDAVCADVTARSQDVVLQSTVFSSLLEDRYQEELAEKMWSWTKVGGGVLWYDFTYDNPSNPDVRGVPVRRVRELFPNGKICKSRLTLAPPIARRVCRVHPSLYSLFNLFNFLRTHILCWIEKSGE